VTKEGHKQHSRTVTLPVLNHLLYVHLYTGGQNPILGCCTIEEEGAESFHTYSKRGSSTEGNHVSFFNNMFKHTLQFVSSPEHVQGS
jgi:hypothetical protein